MESKLKLSTTVMVKQSVEKEIELPYFFRERVGNSVYKIESENRVIKVYVTNNFAMIWVDNKIDTYAISSMEDGTPITEQEYEEDFTRALNTIMGKKEETV